MTHTVREGLDVSKDHILEMACIITDGDLNIIAEVTFLFRAIGGFSQTPALIFITITVL